MLKEYLDINGLTYLWSKLKTKFSSATNWENGSGFDVVTSGRATTEDMTSQEVEDIVEDVIGGLTSDSKFAAISSLELYDLETALGITHAQASRLYNIISAILTSYIKTTFVKTASNSLQVGNILIQWGLETIKTNSSGTTAFPYRGTKVVTFSKAYSSAPIGFANVRDWSNYWTSNANTTSNTTITLDVAGNQNNVQRYVGWLAIGVTT